MVCFADSQTSVQDWDGKAKYRQFTFESESPAVWAALDTGYYYLIDENMVNNSRKARLESKYVFGIVSSLGFVLQFVFAILGLL